MKKLFIGTLSALACYGVALTAVAPKAQADISMNFSAPFISNAGVADARGDSHYFTVAVTGFAIESLRVDIPNQMQISSATVVDNSGSEIPANVTTSEGLLQLDFSQAVEPETYLTVRLEGVNMDRIGGFALYRVSGMNRGLQGIIPVGTARVRLRDKT